MPVPGRMTVSYRDGRVMLSAWVDPVLRDYAREEARTAGVEFSRFVEEAVRAACAKASSDRTVRETIERGLRRRTR